MGLIPKRYLSFSKSWKIQVLDRLFEVHCRSCLVGISMNSLDEIDCLGCCFECITVYLGWVIEFNENLRKLID